MTEPESTPKVAPPRRFGRVMRSLIFFAVSYSLGMLLFSAITKWMPHDPYLRVLASPSSKHPNSAGMPAIGSVMIQNDGGRDATNVVCTVSNCAPQLVSAFPLPPQSATEKRPDGLTVTFPVLKPRETAHVTVVLAEGSSYSEGDVSVLGDGLVGEPWGNRPSSSSVKSLYVLVPAAVLACLVLRRAKLRAARRHESPGGGTAATG